VLVSCRRARLPKSVTSLSYPHTPTDDIQQDSASVSSPNTKNRTFRTGCRRVSVFCLQGVGALSGIITRTEELEYRQEAATQVRRRSCPRITPSSHFVTTFARIAHDPGLQPWTTRAGMPSAWFGTYGLGTWTASTQSREEFPTNHPNSSSTSPYLPHGSLLSHTLQWKRPVRAWAVSMDRVWTTTAVWTG
jgi:hypothetical protein